MTIATSQLKTGSVGVPYDERLLILGGTAPVTVTLAPGFALPPGLTVNAAGRIKGTPTEESAYTINFNVTDATGFTASRSLTLVVTNIAFTDPDILPLAVTGQTYNYHFTATGGINPITFPPTFMPAGLTLASNGTISGTVQPGWEGFYNLFVTATDGLTQIQRRFTMYVADPSPGIPSLNVSPQSLGDLVVGQATQITLGTPDGGRPPYTWAVGPGSTLPPGMSLVAGNRLPASFNPGTTLLAGAPTAAGDYTFDLVATDANGTAMARTYQLHVTTVAFLNVLNRGTAGSMRVGEAFSFQLTAVGGTAPYTYTYEPGSYFDPPLAPGVTLSQGGLFSGTPTSSGFYNARVKVTDSAGHIYTRNITFQVFDFVNGGTGGLQVTTGNMADGAVGIATSQFFGVTRSSGSPPALVNWTVVSGALPPGMDFVVCCGGTYLYGPPSAPGIYHLQGQGNERRQPGGIRRARVHVQRGTDADRVAAGELLPDGVASRNSRYSGTRRRSGWPAARDRTLSRRFRWLPCPRDSRSARTACCREHPSKWATSSSPSR